MGQESRLCRTRRDGKAEEIQLAIAPPNNRGVEEQLIIIPQSAGLCGPPAS
jgi:hypothetical protein